MALCCIKMRGNFLLHPATCVLGQGVLLALFIYEDDAYSFFCTLFNDPVSNTDSVMSNILLSLQHKEGKQSFVLPIH
jgi:hypothetical protein